MYSRYRPSSERLYSQNTRIGVGQACQTQSIKRAKYIEKFTMPRPRIEI